MSTARVKYRQDVRRSLGRCLLPSFVATCLTLFTGCISHSSGARLGDAIIGGVVAKGIEPPVALAEGANEFSVAKKHWPRNYEELSRFLRHSDEKIYTALQAAQFERIEFSDMPDGCLEINADYTIRSKGPFPIENGSGMMRINNMKASIVGMKVSPFEVNKK